VTDGTRDELDPRLGLLADEIRRWNRQINLVTRVDTEDQIPRLIEQCRDGWQLVRAALGREPWFPGGLYIDIGSGAGLPGLVWATARQVAGDPGAGYLIEPREKRAWFLQRTARLLGLDAITVLTTRWGEAPLGGNAPGTAQPAAAGALVSLRALRLGDAEILSGLSAAMPGLGGVRELAIARFLGPQPRSRAQLEDAYVAVLGDGGNGWFPRDARILGTGSPRLFLTRYRR